MTRHTEPSSPLAALRDAAWALYGNVTDERGNRYPPNGVVLEQTYKALLVADAALLDAQPAAVNECGTTRAITQGGWRNEDRCTNTVGHQGRHGPWRALPPVPA